MLGFGLVLAVRRLLPDVEDVAKIAALPLALALLVFYVALLQLVLGDRAVSTGENEEPSCLVIGAVCLSFGFFVATVVGAVAMALR